MKKENILLLSSVAICITLLLGIYDSWKVDIVLGLGIINLVAAFLIRQEQHTKTITETSSKTATQTSVSATSPDTTALPSVSPHTFSNTHSPIDISAHTPVHGEAHATLSPISFSPSSLHDKHVPARKPRRRKVTVEHTLS